jgi:hypothetical protein
MVTRRIHALLARGPGRRRQVAFAAALATIQALPEPERTEFRARHAARIIAAADELCSLVERAHVVVNAHGSLEERRAFRAHLERVTQGLRAAGRAGAPREGMN